MNLPRSAGGDHFEMREWSAGYKAPYKIQLKN